MPPRAALDWASAFVIDADGSLFVAGTTVLANGFSNVRVDHLAADGSLLGSSQWQLPDTAPINPDGNSTQFGGMTRASNGKIYVFARAAFVQSVVQINANGELAEATPLPPLVDDLGDWLALPEPQRLGRSTDGSSLVAGGNTIPWLLGIDATGSATTAWSETLDRDGFNDSVFVGGVAPAPQGGWLVAFGSGSSNGSGQGDYRRAISRLSSDGRLLWQAGDYFTPRTLTDESALRTTSMAVLDDSVLLATPLAADPRNSDDQLLSSDLPFATVARYSLRGDYVQALALSGVVGSATASGDSAVFLLDRGTNQYGVARIDFPALNAVAAAAGEACSASSDCASGACCASALKNSESLCSSSNHCAQGDLCSNSSQCDGQCIAVGNQGFCANTCQKSDDCPQDSFCIEQHCLLACSSGTGCYPGTTCVDAANSEALTVSVCKP